MPTQNKIFNITSDFKVKKSDDGSLTIKGYASTTDIDRAGDVITSDAWTKGGLDNFKRNPIILFNHDYHSPIGKATDINVSVKGLELTAKISKSAKDGISGLIEDGVLGAFSVGFRVKDADYIEETGGLIIKEAELFEVSVVSIPCNQAATFSLAKSFNSMEEYEEFRKTFTNSVPLAGQSLAKKEENSSNVASDTPYGTDNVQTEINMTKEEMDAMMKKVAKEAGEEASAKAAMKYAEQEANKAKALEQEAADVANKEAQNKEINDAIKLGVESGADRLLKEFEAKLAEKDARIDEVLATFKTDLEAKNEEIQKIRDSKRVFGDRNEGGDSVTKWGRDFMEAHLMSVMSGKKDMTDTKFGRDILEKAGIDYATSAGDIDQEVARQIEKEVTINLRTASLFREFRVNGAATVLPIQPDANPATFQTGAATAGNLENRGATDATYRPGQVILNAYRLISQTYMDNNVDEEVLVNLMPMLIDSVARAHARAVDNAVINGAGSITGLDGYATASGTTLGIGAGDKLTAAGLMGSRKLMGKYGISPSDIAYVVSMARYYELVEDAGFSDVSEVGSDVATKLTGTIGAVYGTPVIISDSFPEEAAGVPVAFAVNLRNYVIPRLRGVMVEQDYEVGNQRRVIVATQSLGFEELVEDAAGNYSAVKIDLAT